MVKSDLYRIFNVFLNNEKVADEEFENANINKKIILDGINEGIISKLGSFYILKRKIAGELSMYGDILINNGKLIKGYKCYELCIKLDIDSKARRKKFFIDIKRKDYEEALDYFDLETISFKNIDSFYLYLLGFLYDLPTEYSEYINRYRESFITGKLNFKDDVLHKVIESSLKYKFNDALYHLKMITGENENKIRFSICEELIKCSRNRLININTISYYLNIGQLHIANELIRDYLYNNKNEKYFLLVKNIIKLNYLLGNYNYDLPIKILTDFDNALSEVDYNYYLSILDEEKDSIISNIILKILDELNKLGIGRLDLKKYRLSLK